MTMAPLMLWTLIVALSSRLARSQSGTTVNLKDIVEGRCFDYKISRAGGLAEKNDVNCTNLWSRFTDSWVFNAPCAQSNVSYDELFRVADQNWPNDKSLFWSGTKDFTYELSNLGKRYVTLENTLIGYIADGLFWCGQQTSPGVNFDSCPSYGSCPAESVSKFWTEASKWYASKARGNVYVVLNGSNPTRLAYRRDSTFGSVEIPNLKASEVTKVTALVVHDLGKPVIDSCGKGSLVELEIDLQKHNLKYDCVNNPPQVMSLLCTDSPNSPECSCGRNLAGRPQFLMATQNNDIRRILAFLASLILVVGI